MLPFRGNDCSRGGVGFTLNSQKFLRAAEWCKPWRFCRSRDPPRSASKNALAGAVGVRGSRGRALQFLPLHSMCLFRHP